MKVRLLITFTVGVLIGAIAMFGYVDTQHHGPVMSCTGRVQIDTASHEDIRLNNAIFINNLDAPRGKLYLQFKNDKIMNDTIGMYVTATGPLKSLQLDSGASITELWVNDIQYLPSTSYNSELQPANDVP